MRGRGFINKWAVTSGGYINGNESEGSVYKEARHSTVIDRARYISIEDWYYFSTRAVPLPHSSAHH